MLRTTPTWSATEELSPDANTSSGLSPMQVPHKLAHYHNTQHTRCGCHVSFEIDSITFHRFLVLLNWDRLGTTTYDAMNGKNHYRFHHFSHSLDHCELSDKKGSGGTTWEDPWARSETRREVLGISCLFLYTLCIIDWSYYESLNFFVESFDSMESSELCNNIFRTCLMKNP